MTAVEFYDRTPIENVISMLTTAPQKIVFIGDGNRAKKFLKKMEIFIERKEITTEVVFEKIKRNSLTDIVDVLSKIVETEEQCVFDVTGGDDLVLVAMGIVFQKYRDKNVQIQRFNMNSFQVTDCDNDGIIAFNNQPELTVEENIILHGGAIRYSDNPEKGTYTWQYTEEFINDIYAMWEICCKEPGFWNARIDILEKADEYYAKKDSLSVSFNIAKLKERISADGKKFVTLNGILKHLSDKGLLAYSVSGEEYTVTYKNEQVRLCLTKAGTVLEQVVTLAAKDAVDTDGSSVYNDVMTGVHIDWDGTIHDDSESDKDTKNEIDVFAMKGILPIFISCKNGRVEDDELYKLETVANRFGGVYAKKYLIATYINKNAKSLKSFKQRAEDMGIEIIQDVHIDFCREEFRQTIAKLFKRN